MFYFVNRVTLISSNCSDSEKSETQTKNIWALNLYFRDVNKKPAMKLILVLTKAVAWNTLIIVNSWQTLWHFFPFWWAETCKRSSLKKNGKSKTCVNYGDHLSESLDRLTVEYYFRNKGDSIYFMKGWCRRWARFGPWSQMMMKPIPQRQSGPKFEVWHSTLLNIRDSPIWPWTNTLGGIWGGSRAGRVRFNTSVGRVKSRQRYPCPMGRSLIKKPLKHRTLFIVWILN